MVVVCAYYCNHDLDGTILSSTHSPEVLDRHSSLSIFENVQQNPGPVATITQLPKVRERLLRRSQASLDLGKLITESNEELAIAFALVRRKGEDASDIVVLGTFFLLKTTNQARQEQIRTCSEQYITQCYRFPHSIQIKFPPRIPPTRQLLCAKLHPSRPRYNN